MKLSIFTITGSPCLRCFPHPPSKSTIKWIKKAKRNNFRGPRPNKNSSRLWSHKNEASTSTLVIVSFSNTSIPSITSVDQLTARLLELVPLKSNWENNSLTKMSSNSCPTEPMKSKVTKSVSTPLSEFITQRLNVMYLTALKIYSLINSSSVTILSRLNSWKNLLSTR